MPQPLDRRLMTEATFQAKAAEQDGRLAGYQARIESIETLGGLAPGDLSDATMASLLANLESTFRTGLDSVYAAKANAAAVHASDHGAAGDGVTNDIARISAAMAAAAGGDVLLEGGTTYRIAGTLKTPTWSNRISLRGVGAEPAVLYVDNQSFRPLDLDSEAAAATTTLAASIGIGSHGWQVASTAGIEPGMLCEVISSASWYFDPRPESSDARKSELHRVRRVDAGRVFFDDPANDGYDVAAETVTLSFFRPIKVRLENIKIVATLPAVAEETNALAGITITHADEPELINVSVDGCARSGIIAKLCYRPRIIGGHTARANNFYNGYGVSIDGCAHALVKDRLAIECRRGGDATGQKVISRNTTFEGCTAIGGGVNSRGQTYGWNLDGTRGADQYGFGSHGPADRTTYLNVTTLGILRPFSLRGRDEMIINPRVFGPSHGGVVQCSYGTNLWIKGGIITAGYWSYKSTATHQSGAASSINSRRADCLLRLYPTYQTNTPVGTARGRITVENVSAEVQDKFIMFDGLAPLGAFTVANNDIYFGPTDGAATASLLHYEGTAPTFGKSRWFIGPNRIGRDTGTGPVVTATGISITGANVLNYTPAP